MISNQDKNLVLCGIFGHEWIYTAKISPFHKQCKHCLKVVPAFTGPIIPELVAETLTEVARMNRIFKEFSKDNEGLKYAES